MEQSPGGLSCASRFIAGNEIEAERKFRGAKWWLTPESEILGFLFLFLLSVWLFN